MAIHLSGPPGDIGRAGRPTLDLAPGGVCRAARVTPGAGALLPHRFTLTCAAGRPVAIGGLFSVALSCGSPRLTHVSTLPYGAPTFLDASPRRGHLADSPPAMSMHRFAPIRTPVVHLLSA